MPDDGWWRFLYGFCINLLNFLVCVVGPGLYTRAVLVIILLVLVCLGSVIASFGRGAMQVSPHGIVMELCNCTQNRYSELVWLTVQSFAPESNDD